MDTNRYIEELKQDIEDKFNHSFRSATDFDKLEALVKQNSDETLNASTLKRIWGYSKSESKPRRTTLTVLAKVLGFRDWESYVEKKEADRRIESGFNSLSQVNVADLESGDIISYKWNPNRSVKLRCYDKGMFEVIDQRNSSLRIGDVFRLMFIREGIPIYCMEVERNGERLGDYVAGEQNGIRDLKYQSHKEAEDSEE